MSAAAPERPALVARSLRKLFAREREAPLCALDGVSLEANHGELTALVGPDGAGKTTLMRLAAGLLRADAGSLTVLGVDVAAHPQQVQDRISYMPQRFGLYEDLSVAGEPRPVRRSARCDGRRARAALPATHGHDCARDPSRRALPVNCRAA